VPGGRRRGRSRLWRRRGARALDPDRQRDDAGLDPAGDPGQRRQGQLPSGESELAALPADVNQDVIEALQRGAQNLLGLIEEDCDAPEETTTEETTTEETTTEETTTEETTTEETQPTQPTTPTAPPDGSGGVGPGGDGL
jgi:hypothetical protein